MKKKSQEEPSVNQSQEHGQDEYIIPVIEEEVVVGKRLVSKGGVIVRKEVITEESSFETPVAIEHIDIERVPVNQYQESRPEIRQEGDTMIIPVLKEVVEKRLLLVEEIRITKKVTNETMQEKVTLTKEKVTVREKNEGKGSQNIIR